MSFETVCNGCGDKLDKRGVALEGRRANGLCGGGLPDGEFHLCYDCGAIAFRAITYFGAKGDWSEEWRVCYDVDGERKIWATGLTEPNARMELIKCRRTNVGYHHHLQQRLISRFRVIKP